MEKENQTYSGVNDQFQGKHTLSQVKGKGQDPWGIKEKKKRKNIHFHNFPTFFENKNKPKYGLANPVPPVQMVADNTAIHTKLENKDFPFTSGKFLLPLPSFILGFKTEPYKS